MKKALIVIGLLLISTSLLASTPTGTVALKYSPANADNTCPASGTLLIGAPISLDASGNYSVSNVIGSLSVGAYCIYAHYSGDSSHLPSDATPFLHTVNPSQVSTSTTVTVSPDPSTQGQGVTVSGGVQ